MAIKGLDLKTVEIISKGKDETMILPQKEMVDALVAILERAATQGEFIEIHPEIRCIGKTTALIKFAKKHRFAVIVGNEPIANALRKEYKYDFIYSQNQMSFYGISIDSKEHGKFGWLNRAIQRLGLKKHKPQTNKLARFVVDDCVDHDKIKPLIDKGLVVTGYKRIR